MKGRESGMPDEAYWDSFFDAENTLALLSGARDIPGVLAQITTTVAAAGANIDEVHHQRAFTLLAAQNVEIELVLQTRGKEHVQQVLAQLRSAGMEADLI